MQFLGFMQSKGSSINLPAHWVGGARARNLAAHFAKQNTNFVGAKSEGAAEGGCGGNSAAPEPEAKPRRLLVQSRAEQKNCLFLLEEFFGGARKSQIVKAIFLRGVPSHGTAAGRSGWFRSGISDKMSSSGVVKTHQNLTFGKLTDFFVGGAQRRPCVLPRQFLCARRGEPRLAPAQTEVRLPRDLEILSRICFAKFKNI
jgi:hypothetical protein